MSSRDSCKVNHCSIFNYASARQYRQNIKIKNNKITICIEKMCALYVLCIINSIYELQWKPSITFCCSFVLDNFVYEMGYIKRDELILTKFVLHYRRSWYRNWPRYGLRWSGWYCYPTQHELYRPSRGRFRPRRPAQRVLCRITVPATTAQTIQVVNFYSTTITISQKA